MPLPVKLQAIICLRYLQGDCRQINYTTPPGRHFPFAHPFPEEKIERIEALFSKHSVLWQLTDQLGLEITDAKALRKL